MIPPGLGTGSQILLSRYQAATSETARLPPKRVGFTNSQREHKLPAAPWVLQSCACTRFLLPSKPPFPGSCSIPGSPLLPEKLPGLNPSHSEVSLIIICFLANTHVHFHDICSNFWEPFLACFLSTKGAEKSSSSSSIPPMKTN